MFLFGQKYWNLQLLNKEPKSLFQKISIYIKKLNQTMWKKNKAMIISLAQDLKKIKAC